MCLLPRPTLSHWENITTSGNYLFHHKEQEESDLNGQLFRILEKFESMKFVIYMSPENMFEFINKKPLISVKLHLRTLSKSTAQESDVIKFAA